MASGFDEFNPASQPLTRREARERERAADAARQPSAPESSAGTDGIAALFGGVEPTRVEPARAVEPTPSPELFRPIQPTAPAAVVVAPISRPTPVAPPTSWQQPSASSGHSPHYATTPTLPKKSAPAPKKRVSRTIGSRLLSLGAMVFAGALAFGMSVPANAFISPSSAILDSAGASPKVLQSVEVASNVESASVARDKWQVLSWAEVLKERYGTRDFSYRPGSGSIRWPFPYAVPISSGFGERVAPCRGCSSHHMGVDFNPGNGAAIFAIADGTVVVAQEDRWGFGNHVVLEHHIGGHTVLTTYAHMQYGTSTLQVGDQVLVGDLIGLVGMTGTATGPHLHLEITVDGVRVDPFAWLKTNAN